MIVRRRLRRAIAKLRCALGIHHPVTTRNIRTGWVSVWCVTRGASLGCGRLLALRHSQAERTPRWLGDNWPESVSSIITDDRRVSL